MNGISPELAEAIRAHARKLAAAAPMATPEQIETLRRWFGTRRVRDTTSASNAA